jgi:hypothetical protein
MTHLKNLLKSNPLQREKLGEVMVSIVEEYSPYAILFRSTVHGQDRATIVVVQWEEGESKKNDEPHRVWWIGQNGEMTWNSPKGTRDNTNRRWDPTTPRTWRI